MVITCVILCVIFMDDGQNPAKQLEWEITISNELEVGDIHHINLFVGWIVQWTSRLSWMQEFVSRTFNACDGDWPEVRLEEPPLKKHLIAAIKMYSAYMYTYV